MRHSGRFLPLSGHVIPPFIVMERGVIVSVGPMTLTATIHFNRYTSVPLMKSVLRRESAASPTAQTRSAGTMVAVEAVGSVARDRYVITGLVVLPCARERNAETTVVGEAVGSVLSTMGALGAGACVSQIVTARSVGRMVVEEAVAVALKGGNASMESA